ncbi:MAG: DUF2892 domain-containing protein [Burkholderiaceae bacterium]
MFKTNVGGVDRVLRISIGALLVALTALGILSAWGWIGIVPIITGLTRTCPLYSLIGLNTCPLKASAK